VFLKSPKVLHVIPGKINILGITVLGSEIFVVRGAVQKVSVYDFNSYKLQRKIHIPESKRCIGIVACQHNNCLYVRDDKNVIYRYDIELSSVINSWPLGGSSCGYGGSVSLTHKYSVLVVLGDGRLKEFDPVGNLIKDIQIDGTIYNPAHSIELSNKRYLVSHQIGLVGSQRSGVSILNENGLVVQSYCRIPESDVKQMNGPLYMAVDKQGQLLVLDRNNDRVELLSPTLTHLGYIQIPGYDLKLPGALHLDELNHRLYIGESSKNSCYGSGGHGRLFVLDTNSQK